MFAVCDSRTDKIAHWLSQDSLARTANLDLDCLSLYCHQYVSRFYAKLGFRSFGGESDKGLYVMCDLRMAGKNPIYKPWEDPVLSAVGEIVSSDSGYKDACFGLGG